MPGVNVEQCTIPCKKEKKKTYLGGFYGLFSKKLGLDRGNCI